MRYAALMLGVLAANLPGDAYAQGAKAAFQDNYADVNGVRLHYVNVGTGPLILFLHGYPSFWYQWKDQMAEMGRDHLAVGLDMRGYNLSSKPEGLEPYKMKHLVEDVRQFAEKIGGEDKKFVLVAHDWGAQVAWVFAMYHPELLEKLIIINGAHPFISERELRENPAQRYASNYFFVFNGYLAPGEQPIDEQDTPERAIRRARTGFVDAAATPKTIAGPGSTRGRSLAPPRVASTTTEPITVIRRSTIVIPRR
jgi:pimeloyl-ACP methyl ester carboxylesterase